jgi:hypothetical protein
MWKEAVVFNLKYFPETCTEELKGAVKIIRQVMFPPKFEPRNFLRSHVTGSNDVILNKVGRTTAVSLVGTHHEAGMCWDTALGHLLVVPLGNDSLGVWFCMTSRGWRLSSHKGQWRVYDRSLPRGGTMTLGYHYGLPGTNAGEHSYGGILELSP